MKRLLATILLLSLSISLVACSPTESDNQAEIRQENDINTPIDVQYQDSGFDNLPLKATIDVFAMDTVMTLTVYAENEDQAKKALSAGAKELYKLDNLLSTNIATSELYKLNRDKTITFSSDGIELMKRSKEFYEKTDGIFNIAIYPIVKAWGFTTNARQVPSDDTLKNLLPLCDFNDITFDNQTGVATLKKEGMGIDFGGIAKGYASAKLMSIFREHGIKSALVSLGGNVQLLGKKPNDKDFNVAIQNPNNPDEYFCTIKANDKAIITSGAYQRFFEQGGKTYHHIIDPRTGKPADSGLTSVTIITDDGTLGDSLATTLFILGKDKAINFWRAHQDEFDMVLVDKDNNVYVSEPISEQYSDNDFKAPTIVRRG